MTFELPPIQGSSRPELWEKSADLAESHARNKAERDFQALFLRESLKEMSEKLFKTGMGGAPGFGTSANEMYSHFLEEALSWELAGSWPLPNPFAEPGASANEPALGGHVLGEGASSGVIPGTTPGATVDASPKAAESFPLDRTRGLELDSRPFRLGRGTEAGGAAHPIEFDAGRFRDSSSAQPIPFAVPQGNPIPIGPTDRLPGPSRLQVAPTALPGTGPGTDASLGPQTTSGSIDSGSRTVSDSQNAPGVLRIEGNRKAEKLPESIRSTLTPRKTERRDLPEAEIERASRLFGVPANLVRAVVIAESSGRSGAVSSKGAQGLMQLMPETAKEMGISDPFDEWQNIYAGTKYLSQQIDRFGDVKTALAAYNAGPGTVTRYGGIPPYPETERYVETVMKWQQRLESADSFERAPRSAPSAPASEE